MLNMYTTLLLSRANFQFFIPPFWVTFTKVFSTQSTVEPVTSL
jgi:hypothetical protein